MGRLFPLAKLVKKHIVSVTTDGAPAMANAFMHAVKNWTAKPIIHIWCLAHKLNFGVNQSVQKTELIEFSSLVTTTNKVHILFTTSTKYRAILH
jgi:hypothetical protein